MAVKTTEGKLPHPWGNTRKSWSDLPPPVPWLEPETKRWNLRSAQRSHFIELHQEQEEKLIYVVEKACVTCE